MTLVSARGLEIGHDGVSPIACPDFSLGDGDFVCIIGPNGSGKSTLVKTVAGLLAPRGGELSVDGGIRHGGIGYMPQRSPLQDDFPATVREVVRTGCQALRGWRPFFSRGEKRLADEAMERMGIAELSVCPYRMLSGGQRQRVLLARAVCVPRRLLLLDEPTAGLDEESAAAFCAVLSELGAGGMAIAMVTHDRQAVRRLAGRVLALGPHRYFRTVPSDGRGGCDGK